MAVVAEVVWAGSPGNRPGDGAGIVVGAAGPAWVMKDGSPGTSRRLRQKTLFEASCPLWAAQGCSQFWLRDNVWNVFGVPRRLAAVATRRCPRAFELGATGGATE